MKILNLGCVSYQEGLDLQKKLLEDLKMVKLQRSVQSEDETLIFCSHLPVVTLGRGTQPGDVICDGVQAWKGEVVEISRGGRATYHGPSQVVVYPILDLERPRKNLPACDLHAFLRAMENAAISTLQEFGISARGEIADATGVWIEPKSSTEVMRKIASLGIAVSKWCTLHGLAFNLDYDPKAFTGINPCGFQTSTMISLEEVLGHKMDRTKFEKTLESFLLSELS